MLKKVFHKFSKQWKKENIAMKTMLILAVISFFHTSAEFLQSQSRSMESDLGLRSIMLSIFGYILGSKVVNKYNNSDKFNTMVASFISLSCITVIIISGVLNVDQKSQSAVAIKSLLASSIGFLTSKSTKNNYKN